ncbi:MAG TPA: hypothetical protein VF235_00110 [Actinomycetota bacterium]
MPKTVRGWLLTLILVVPPVFLVTNMKVIFASPILWTAIAAAALVYGAFRLWRRREDAARERAWVGEFSFADSVRRVRGQEALRLQEDTARRAALLHRSMPAAVAVVPVED